MFIISISTVSEVKMVMLSIRRIIAGLMRAGHLFNVLSARISLFLTTIFLFVHMNCWHSSLSLLSSLIRSPRTRPHDRTYANWIPDNAINNAEQRSPLITLFAGCSLNGNKIIQTRPTDGTEINLTQINSNLSKINRISLPISISDKVE